jgi:hypothetical protein
MKQRKIRYLIKGIGNKCNQCNQPMERRTHKEKPLKNWYYTEWDICKNELCKKTVQHYEEFKSNDWIEAEQSDNHLRDISMF